MTTKYEYGIEHYRMPAEGHDLHRGPYRTIHEAQSWINEAENDGFNVGVFRVVRRPVSEWEQVE